MRRNALQFEPASLKGSNASCVDKPQVSAAAPFESFGESPRWGACKRLE
jgi:hypothetical protein